MGLVGIVSRDGRPVSVDELRPMMRAGLSWTTESAPHGVFGWTSCAGATAGARVAAAGRIDNADGESLRARHDREGVAFAARLVGDFTAALWDERSVVLVRDGVGGSPLYYHLSASTLVFATELKAVLAVPSVPRRLDECTIADHLTSIREDHERTFHLDVRRVPPGHALRVLPDRHEFVRVWRLDRDRALPPGDSREYAERFLELLRQAVKRRLVGVAKPSIMLSGGLDSSAIACLLREGRTVTAYSLAFPEDEASDERSYVRALARQGGLELREIDGTALNVWEELPAMLRACDEPPSATPQFYYARVHREAAKDGVDGVFDGFDGDSTVSYGLAFLHELLAGGRLGRFRRELTAFAGRYGIEWYRLLAWYVVNPAMGGSWRSSLKWMTGRGGPPWDPDRILNPDFAKRAGVAARWKASRPQGTYVAAKERHEHVRMAEGAGVVGAGEWIERTARECGTAALHPFRDRDLIEFCVALPPEEKMGGGLTRTVLRRAMEPLFPPELRGRLDKSRFSRRFARSLVPPGENPLGPRDSEENRIVAPYVEWKSVERVWERYRRTGSGSDVIPVWWVLTLREWLKTNTGRREQA